MTRRRRTTTRRSCGLALRQAPRRRGAGVIAGLVAVLLLLLLTAGGLLGAAGPVAARSQTFHHNDDWLHLWAVLDHFETQPPTVPVVYLLGGSAARECTTLDAPWSDQVSRLAGRKIRTINLGAAGQSFLRDITIVDRMPHVPSVMLIGINLGRFATKPPVRSVAAAHRPLGSILTSYTQHRFVAGDVLDDAAKRVLLSKWVARRYPAFKAHYAYDFHQLDLLVAECQRLGLHPELVNLPLNDAIVRPALDAPRAKYAKGCRALAARYHIHYFDFVGQVGLKSQDFVDLWHCVPSGRVKFQARLSRVIHRVIDEVGLGKG
jgi:hypothetical protein